MKKYLLVFLVAVSVSITASAAEFWGQNGHRATGQIAEMHLSKKAKKNIEKLLNGESLAFVSTYADEIKSDSRYREYGPWHYVNFPFGGTYETSEKSEKGDLVQAIKNCKAVLKDKNASKEDKVFYLKLLVHFIGDLHQPLHVGISEDKGGNDFQVQWFGNGTNLHSVWDTKMIEDFNMSYRELAYNTKKLSKNEVLQIKGGSLLDWVSESRALCEDIYANTKVGEKLSYQYSYRYMDTLRGQLQKGGIRLAKILNEIYG